MEIVVAAANPAGAAEIVRLRLNNALFRPHAKLELTENGFVARCAYESPRYPGRWHEVPVLLVAAPLENAA